MIYCKEKVVFKFQKISSIAYYIKDAYPLFLTSLLISVKDKFNYILLGNHVTMGDVVTYDLGAKFVTLLTKPAAILGTVLFPKMAKEKIEDCLKRPHICCFAVLLYS